ncbi:uncharacterized protein LOC131804727 [Musca domestica]|uniref:Uncharacterized protein LOC131804727 n=1 Tax=Musca domestica TaxID=7370 RepID=A0ABM3VDT3_MUSDO|nr:uncharacterized protein LOC131804727 [Musca domestica]
MVRKRSNLGRKSRNARNAAAHRAAQSDEQRAKKTLAVRNAMARLRALRNATPRPYVRRTLDVNFDYISHGKVSNESTTTGCPHCKALKLEDGVCELCCSSSQIKLPELNLPPEPLPEMIKTEKIA